jgi:hypothetical protein
MVDHRNEIEETFDDFHDFQDFAASIVHPELDFTPEAIDLYLRMAYIALEVYFHENIPHTDFEHMGDDQGHFRWHLLKNKNQVFVMCIWHKLYQSGNTDPVKAIFNLRVYSNIQHCKFSQHSRGKTKL